MKTTLWIILNKKKLTIGTFSVNNNRSLNINKTRFFQNFFKFNLKSVPTEVLLKT